MPQPPKLSLRLSTAQEKLLRTALDTIQQLLRETERSGTLYPLAPRHAANCTRFSKSLRRAVEQLLELT